MPGPGGRVYGPNESKANLQPVRKGGGLSVNPQFAAEQTRAAQTAAARNGGKMPSTPSHGGHSATKPYHAPAPAPAYPAPASSGPGTSRSSQQSSPPSNTYANAGQSALQTYWKGRNSASSLVALKRTIEDLRRHANDPVVAKQLAKMEQVYAKGLTRQSAVAASRGDQAETYQSAAKDSLKQFTAAAKSKDPEILGRSLTHLYKDMQALGSFLEKNGSKLDPETGRQLAKQYNRMASAYNGGRSRLEKLSTPVPDMSLNADNPKSVHAFAHGAQNLIRGYDKLAKQNPAAWQQEMTSLRNRIAALKRDQPIAYSKLDPKLLAQIEALDTQAHRRAAGKSVAEFNRLEQRAKNDPASRPEQERQRYEQYRTGQARKRGERDAEVRTVGTVAGAQVTMRVKDGNGLNEGLGQVTTGTAGAINGVVAATVTVPLQLGNLGRLGIGLAKGEGGKAFKAFQENAVTIDETVLGPGRSAIEATSGKGSSRTTAVQGAEIGGQLLTGVDAAPGAVKFIRNLPKAARELPKIIRSLPENINTLRKAGQELPKTVSDAVKSRRLNIRPTAQEPKTPTPASAPAQVLSTATATPSRFRLGKNGRVLQNGERPALPPNRPVTPKPSRTISPSSGIPATMTIKVKGGDAGLPENIPIVENRMLFPLTVSRRDKLMRDVNEGPVSVTKEDRAPSSPDVSEPHASSPAARPATKPPEGTPPRTAPPPPHSSHASNYHVRNAPRPGDGVTPQPKLRPEPAPRPMTDANGQHSSPPAPTIADRIGLNAPGRNGGIPKPGTIRFDRARPGAEPVWQTRQEYIDGLKKALENTLHDYHMLQEYYFSSGKMEAAHLPDAVRSIAEQKLSELFKGTTKALEEIEAMNKANQLNKRTSAQVFAETITYLRSQGFFSERQLSRFKNMDDIKQGFKGLKQQAAENARDLFLSLPGRHQRSESHVLPIVHAKEERLKKLDQAWQKVVDKNNYLRPKSDTEMLQIYRKYLVARDKIDPETVINYYEDINKAVRVHEFQRHEEIISTAQDIIRAAGVKVSQYDRGQGSLNAGLSSIYSNLRYTPFEYSSDKLKKLAVSYAAHEYNQYANRLVTEAQAIWGRVAEFVMPGSITEPRLSQGIGNNGLPYLEQNYPSSFNIGINDPYSFVPQANLEILSPIRNDYVKIKAKLDKPLNNLAQDLRKFFIEREAHQNNVLRDYHEGKIDADTALYNVEVENMERMNNMMGAMKRTQTKDSVFDKTMRYINYMERGWF